MEFKYRAIDHTHLPPDTQPPPPSSFTFSGDHLHQGVSGPARPGYNAPSPLGGPSYGLANDDHRLPTDSKEVIWLEMEKERIREEIIMEEIVRRRRMVESEVRNEMMFGRHMRLQGLGAGFFFSAPQSTLRDPIQYPDPILHHKVEGSSLREKIEQSLEDGIIMSSALKPKFSSLERAPGRSGEPKISEVKPELETSNNEDRRITLMEKEEDNVSGMKRKTVIQPTVDLQEKAEEHVSGTKRKTVIQPNAESSESLSVGGTPNKKMKQDWRCTLCEVSATSEQSLNDHLQGKKHKAKEAGKNGKVVSIGWSPSPIKKLDGRDRTPAAYKAVGPRSSLEAETSSNDTMRSGHLQGKKHKAKEAEKNGKDVSIGWSPSPIKKLDLHDRTPEAYKTVGPRSSSENTMRSGNPLLSSEKQIASEENKGPVGIKNNSQDDKKNLFMFWCAMCQVGTQSMKVMEDHSAGKKHLRLLKFSGTQEADEVNLPTS